MITGIVVAEAVVVEGCTVLVEFSDGGLSSYTTVCPFTRCQLTAQRFDANSMYGPYGLKFKTKDQIRNLIGQFNKDALANQRERAFQKFAASFM